jgi:hypothetical protein
MAAARLVVKPFRQRFCQAGTCRAQFFLCAACDHGQRYCSPACRVSARTLQRRAARQRHQRSLAGRLDHRDRQRAYRLRQAAAARALLLPPRSLLALETPPSANRLAENTVTDHGSQAALPSGTVPRLATMRWPAAARRSLSALGELLCQRCGRLGRWLNPFYAPSG